MIEEYGLETANTDYFFIVEAGKDDARKYVGESFRYTRKINKARRFQKIELAKRFIQNFNEHGRYPLTNPEIKKVYRSFVIGLDI